jgi:hypothetical protein
MAATCLRARRMINHGEAIHPNTACLDHINTRARFRVLLRAAPASDLVARCVSPKLTTEQVLIFTGLFLCSHSWRSAAQAPPSPIRRDRAHVQVRMEWLRKSIWYSESSQCTRDYAVAWLKTYSGRYEAPRCRTDAWLAAAAILVVLPR